jgi:Ca2+-binding RTX toxin-like protein
VHSIDGSGSLSVRGTAADDAIAIAKQGSACVVTDAGIAFSTADVDGCEAVGGNAVCAADVKTIVIDAGGGNDSVSVDGSIPPEIEVRIEGGPGSDRLQGGRGGDVLEAGDDNDPDLLEGGAGDDALVGARTDLPVPYNSGKSTLVGGPGSDVMVGGDPCDGDVFDGGPGEDDANFFRFTPGVNAEIGGPVTRAGSPCTPGHVDSSVEQLEGSPGPDVLIGGHRDSLIGHGGRNRLRLRK